MKLLKPAVAGALAVVNLLAQAGNVAPSPIVTVTGTNSKTETRAYLGLNWTLGGTTTPELVLGVTNTKVKTGGDTTGANLAFHLNLTGGVQPGKLKLSYLDGDNDVQGELGIGVNFLTAAPMVFLGLRGPYVAAGVDAYLGLGFVPYAMIHTSGSFDEPSGGTTTLSCLSPWVLSGSSCISPPPPPPSPT